jgi:hypothetical protein
MIDPITSSKPKFNWLGWNPDMLIQCVCPYETNHDMMLMKTSNYDIHYEKTCMSILD